MDVYALGSELSGPMSPRRWSMSFLFKRAPNFRLFSKGNPYDESPLKIPVFQTVEDAKLYSEMLGTPDKSDQKTVYKIELNSSYKPENFQLFCDLIQDKTDPSGKKKPTPAYREIPKFMIKEINEVEENSSEITLGS